MLPPGVLTGTLGAVPVSAQPVSNAETERTKAAVLREDNVTAKCFLFTVECFMRKHLLKIDS